SAAASWVCWTGRTSQVSPVSIRPLSRGTALICASLAVLPEYRQSLLLRCSRAHDPGANGQNPKPLKAPKRPPGTPCSMRAFTRKSRCRASNDKLFYPHHNRRRCFPNFFGYRPSAGFDGSVVGNREGKLFIQAFPVVVVAPLDK